MARSDDGIKAIEAYVSALGLDAYLVGGVVRDELLGRESPDADFLVPGLDGDSLAQALAPHGKVEALVVAGRVVGSRLSPRDAEIRALAPAGIEFAPVRRERSTGPGRHDFEIVVDPEGSVEDDLARRDFTINAIARRVADDRLVDPFGGRRDLEARILRTVSPQSFAEDPLRLVRGLRFVSQLDLDPDPDTVAQMREQAASVALVSGERIGGGLAADGMGELSKLLLGSDPEKALSLARDTGVLEALIPAFGVARGVREAGWELTLDEHILRVVQVSSELGHPLRVRLAALLHDLGKAQLLLGMRGGAAPTPATVVPVERHGELGAEIAAETLARLRYPTDLRRRVVAIVRFHSLDIGAGDAHAARALLARHGAELARDLVDLREADLRGKTRHGPADPEALERHLAFSGVLEGELASPYRLEDLAVDGGDMIALGYRPGPALGAALAALLDEVVDDPERNRRASLLDRAREMLPDVIGWQLPGPYRIGFTTREGGVSEGVFTSLNLAGGHDDPAAVSENRRIACAELGLDAGALTFARQRHSATVKRARPGVVEVGDALWTDEPDVPLMALGADCAPIAIVSTHGRPALAVVHAGWRGLAAGVVEAAVAALGARRSVAMVGPAIGPCCYEVGPEVSARFDPDLSRGGILDLWGAARRALERAGVARVEQLGLCTRCNPELFFSFRATGSGAHGAQGVIGALER